MAGQQEPGLIAPGECTTIAEVIAQMEQIDSVLPRKDGVAYFNRLYLQVTKAVQAAAAGVTFAAPAFAERLDVVFAACTSPRRPRSASGRSARSPGVRSCTSARVTLRRSSSPSSA